MRRRLMLVGCVLVLVVAAWGLGSAQARREVADFQVTVDAPPGELRVTCSKGCDWSGIDHPIPDAIVDRCASLPCRLIFNGNGRITVGQPVGKR